MSNLAYSVVGEGFPLVFLHGFCEDATMWNEVIRYGFPKYKVITVDLPGFGKSSIDKPYSIEEMAVAVHSLLQNINVSSSIIIGHSMGGYVALAYAEKYSNFLKGLGLIHSHPFEDSPEGKVNRQRAADFISKFGSVLFVKQLLPKLFPKSFVTSNRFLLERIVYDASKYPAEGIRNGLIAMKNRSDKTNVLKRLAIPFLAIVGKKDELLPTEKLMEQLSMANITQAEVLEKIGHMGPFENPKLIHEKVHSYLNNFSAP